MAWRDNPRYLVSLHRESRRTSLGELRAIITALHEGTMLGAVANGSGQGLTATSLSNVLLAAMARCPASESAVVVARFRDASTDPTKPSASDTARPILDHQLFTRPHTLGEALDAIFLSYAAEDGFDDEG